MTAPDVRPPADLELDAYLEPFEAAAARGDDPDPADFLPPPAHPKYTAVLAELLRLDLEFAWDRGEDRRVEAYANRFPALFADPALLAAVAGEEYRLRRAAGEGPDPSAYQDRLPVGEAGSDPFQTHVLAPGPVWDGAALPAVGEFVPPGFRIRSELGRGAFGRVYLAEQADLAGRLVAVKISSRLVGEAQTLARLQHTHIVPVYAVHRVGGYQLLVMPYLGSATLADLVTAIRGSGAVPATAKAIQTAISSRAGGVAAAPEPKAGPTTPPPAGALVGAPYADAILDIGIALADGLAHAHARGVLHRDLKPANVLLTDDGRPMLLDFNLAADDRAATRTVGGTPRYMAPEQLAGLTDPTVPVDARADVYALGLVLHELLTGRLPFAEPDARGAELIEAMRADRMRPPAIDLASPAVSAVLRKCLAPDPARRYASAAAVRDDLARQRANRRLADAPEPLSRERLSKWARRHPRLSSGTTVAVAAALLLALVGWGGYTAWRHGGDLEAREARATVRLTRDQVQPLLADPYPPVQQLKQVRDRSLDALAPYRVAGDADWRTARTVRRLPAEALEPFRDEYADLLFYAAEATARLADREADPGRRGQFRDEALVLNARAADVYPAAGPVRPVVVQRVRLLRRAGRADDAEAASRDLDRAVQPGAGDQFRKALADLWEKRYAAAAATLEDLTSRGRESYSAWMALGTARLRMQQYDRAADAFVAAAALEPDDPWPVFYRGVALLGGGRYGLAVETLDRFLARAPAEADGWLNRAIARFRLGDAAAALADLAEAERLGESPARVHGLRLQVWRAKGELAKAAAEYKLLLACEPDGPDAWTVRAEARLPTDPAGAVADFDAALALEPDFLPALRGKASGLSEGLNRPADAALVLDRVNQIEGATVEDRAASAVLLARLGRATDARTRARQCLAPDTPPVPLYQAASALALMARTPADRAEVVAILRRVLRGDVAWAKDMAGDPDLKAVHADAAFQALVAAGKVVDGGGK